GGKEGQRAAAIGWSPLFWRACSPISLLCESTPARPPLRQIGILVEAHDARAKRLVGNSRRLFPTSPDQHRPRNRDRPRIPPAPSTRPGCVVKAKPGRPTLPP